MVGWIAAYLGISALNFYSKKESALRKAIELCDERGIVNIGSGPTKEYAQAIADDPHITLNVDVLPDSRPNFLQADLNQYPWPIYDNQFSCALASHVLEHLDDPLRALQELQRIADFVVIVLPNPLSISGQINPEHVSHFSFSDIDSMRRIPNMFVYC